MTLKRQFGLTLEETTLEQPFSLEVDWEFQDAGFLLFDVNGDPQHNGTARTYSDPTAVANGSPWSFQGSEFSLRLDFEDDNNCGVGAPGAIPEDEPNDDHSDNFNANPQIGLAYCTISANRTIRSIIQWEGMGEQHSPQEPPDPVDDPDEWDRIDAEFFGVFDEMRLFVQHIPDPNNPPSLETGKDEGTNESMIGRAIGPGGGLRCADMAPVISDPRLPGFFDFLQGEVYRIRIWSSTNDELYHFGAYYKFDLQFQEV